MVLTGEGEQAFVGGADIAEMATISSPKMTRRFIEGVHQACAVVRGLRVPVIARVNGYAFGAGLELMAACDLRLAAQTAQFGMPEVLVGVPSVVEAALLPGLIDWDRTRRLLLLGETIGASQALDWGLVGKVVAPPELDSAVDAWLDRLVVARPKAMRAQKALIHQSELLPLARRFRPECPPSRPPGKAMNPRC